MNELQWLQELEDKANVEIEWEQIYSDWETTIHEICFRGHTGYYD